MSNIPAQPINNRRKSRPASVGRLVGSVGRQGMQFPVSREGEELARSMVFSDRLDLHKPEPAEQDSLLLEQGAFAPSEHARVAREHHDLLRRSSMHHHSDSHASSSSAPPDPIITAGRGSVSNYGAVDEEACWDEAVADGDIQTGYTLEFTTLSRNAFPLSITFFLQYSLFMTSLLCVGHLGKIELGAVSLGTMTASITGVAFVQGMSTCLDTLCSQAFGAGRPDLVGLYFQKGVLLILLGLSPVMMLWFKADRFLGFIVANDKDSDQLVHMAAKYMRVMILAMPGFTLFECGKRFLQSQGIFHASTIVLVACAPLNVILTYTLVWNKHIGMGFLGAPYAVALTNTLMALLLFSYVALVDGKQCWNGFTWRAFHNWGNLVRLAIPGLVMVESEFLAYEVMTLAASYLGTNELAAQTIMSSVTALVYEIPFAVGCAVSTRIATFIGANVIDAAKLVTKMGLLLALLIGLFNGSVILVFRHTVASFFTQDEEVLSVAAHYLPMCSLMHVFDCIACVLAGILRGQGRQQIGGYINLGCYHLIGVPLGILLCFGRWHLGLAGIWLGFYAALLSVTAFSLYALRMSDWKSYVRLARDNSQ